MVDACARELLATGYISFQSRHLMARFLICCLGIDWQHGQRHLAQHMIDYDWSINDCNWHQVASLAMFAPNWCLKNPIEVDPEWVARQWDPDGNYIRKWIPEVRDIPTEDLHTWSTSYVKYRKKQQSAGSYYRRPIIDVKAAIRRVRALYTHAALAIKLRDYD